MTEELLTNDEAAVLDYLRRAGRVNLNAVVSQVFRCSADDPSYGGPGGVWDQAEQIVLSLRGKGKVGCVDSKAVGFEVWPLDQPDTVPHG